MPGSASSWSLVAELMSSRSALAAVAVEVLDGVLAACATAIPLIMLNAKSTTRILVMSRLLIVVSPITSGLLVASIAMRFLTPASGLMLKAHGPTFLRKTGRTISCTPCRGQHVRLWLSPRLRSYRHQL